MVYSSKQQPTTPLLVVGHEISYSSNSSNGDNSNTNSNSHRRGGNGNAAAAGGRGGVADSGAGSAGGHSAALGYWNRSPVALNKSSNRYIDQSKAFIVEDAFTDSLKRGGGGGGGGSPYYHHHLPPPPPLQALNHHHQRHHAGGYYGSNGQQQQQHSDSRNNSMTRPTNRSNAMNENLSEVSRRRRRSILRILQDMCD